MPKFVIEGEIPVASILTLVQISELSQKSCDVLDDLGTIIQWVHDYVTDNKVFCIYNSISKELIFKHVNRARFPAHIISKISAKINPTTAE